MCDRFQATTGNAAQYPLGVVEGTFDATSRGHLGMWGGTIRDITRLERWPSNPEELPT